MEVRKLFDYKGKYWQADDGSIWRKDIDGALVPVASTGHPLRVRLYQNGKCVRKYLHVIWRETYPERPEGPPSLPIRDYEQPPLDEVGDAVFNSTETQ